MKKGFTLIEIMVVIVIMGVLAAVGVPKLFGVIAKAKVSEAPVAAGTYIALQDAFISEGIAIGNWKIIGYEPPGVKGVSQYFRYEPVCETETIPDEDFKTTVVGWKASNLTKLNDCAAGSAWVITMTPGTSSKIEYGRVVESPLCAMLTSTDWSIGNAEGDCPTPRPKSSSSAAAEPESSASEPETPTSTPSSSPSSVSSSATPSNDNQCNQGNDKQNCGNGQLKKQSSSSAAPVSSATNSDNQCNQGNDKQNCGNGQLKKQSSSSAAPASSNSGSIGGSGSNTGSGSNAGSGGNSGSGGSNSTKVSSSSIQPPPSSSSKKIKDPKTNKDVDPATIPDPVCTQYNGKSQNCKSFVSKEKCLEYIVSEKRCSNFSN